MKSTTEQLIDHVIKTLQPLVAQEVLKARTLDELRTAIAQFRRTEIALFYYAEPNSWDLLMKDGRGRFITDFGKTARDTLFRIGITDVAWERETK